MGRAACVGSGDQAGADRSALASDAGTAAAGRAGPGAFLGVDPAVHHRWGVGLGGGRTVQVVPRPARVPPGAVLSAVPGSPLRPGPRPSTR